MFSYTRLLGIGCVIIAGVIANQMPLEAAMSDNFRRMLEQEDALRRAIDPYGASRQQIDAMHPALAVVAGSNSYLSRPTASSQLLDGISVAAKARNDFE